MSAARGRKSPRIYTTSITWQYSLLFKLKSQPSDDRQILSHSNLSRSPRSDTSAKSIMLLSKSTRIPHALACEAICTASRRPFKFASDCVSPDGFISIHLLAPPSHTMKQCVSMIPTVPPTYIDTLTHVYIYLPRPASTDRSGPYSPESKSRRRARQQKAEPAFSPCYPSPGSISIHTNKKHLNPYRFGRP